MTNRLVRWTGIVVAVLGLLVVYLLFLLWRERRRAGADYDEVIESE